MKPGNLYTLNKYWVGKQLMPMCQTQKCAPNKWLVCFLTQQPHGPSQAALPQHFSNIGCSKVCPDRQTLPVLVICQQFGAGTERGTESPGERSHNLSKLILERSALNVMQEILLQRYSRPVTTGTAKKCHLLKELFQPFEISPTHKITILHIQQQANISLTW